MKPGLPKTLNSLNPSICHSSKPHLYTWSFIVYINHFCFYTSHIVFPKSQIRMKRSTRTLPITHHVIFHLPSLQSVISSNPIFYKPMNSWMDKTKWRRLLSRVIWKRTSNYSRFGLSLHKHLEVNHKFVFHEEEMLAKRVEAMTEKTRQHKTIP